MSLLLKKRDDVYLEVSGERSEMQMLSDYFTFFVPGYKFMPSYRNKFWDGKIRLFDTRNQTIYKGLLNQIAKFSEDMSVEIDYEGPKYEVLDNHIDDHICEGFMKVLDPHSKGEKIVPHDYQIEAFKYAVEKQRCLLLSPTASGKSLIIYSLMRWYRQTHDRKILIIVPSVSLVSQLASDFRDYSNNTFHDMHMITSGVAKATRKRVVISTWQSIHKMPYEWFQQFGSVIVDEVHHATAKSLTNIMCNLTNCPDRVGLTGTLTEAKTHNLVLEGLFGPVNKVTTTKNLIDDDKVSKLKINVVKLDYDEQTSKDVVKYKYQEEIDWLLKNDKRNEFISRLSSSVKGNTLCIFGRLEHGKLLYERIKERTDKQVLYVAGETDKDTREAVRLLAEHEDVIIVASLGVFSTGINIKRLHNLIFSHPTKSKIKVLQSIGRVLRKSNDGLNATVYDIIDDMSYKSSSNYTLKHGAERVRYYAQEQFDYNINNLKL